MKKVMGHMDDFLEKQCPAFEGGCQGSDCVRWVTVQ
jgi:hypothetical protein